MEKRTYDNLTEETFIVNLGAYLIYCKRNKLEINEFISNLEIDNLYKFIKHCNYKSIIDIDKKNEWKFTLYTNNITYQSYEFPKYLNDCEILNIKPDVYTSLLFVNSYEHIQKLTILYSNMLSNKIKSKEFDIYKKCILFELYLKIIYSRYCDLDFNENKEKLHTIIEYMFNNDKNTRIFDISDEDYKKIKLANQYYNYIKHNDIKHKNKINYFYEGIKIIYNLYDKLNKK